MEKPKFVPAIPIFLKCSICFLIFVKPSRIDCGHTFCLDCINAWIKKKSPATCPICRELILKPSNDLIADHVINNWKVFCNVKGCDWTGKYEVYYQHTHNSNIRMQEIPKYPDINVTISNQIDKLISSNECIDNIIGEQIKKGMSYAFINELILTYQEKNSAKRSVELTLPIYKKKYKQ
ncbi:hypothetical protein SteCoe_3591 [Stentor coeruleus]|uniref:RING-type domain-containing protein n=1 Tax=Stentor coeruleus TaxID=5963 RepID=A0A1R2CWT0_9CILI|nr:hypothetical protein SteCoe_3591 [Stentor coeruleus]